jgi:hypothetical protein
MILYSKNGCITPLPYVEKAEVGLTVQQLVIYPGTNIVTKEDYLKFISKNTFAANQIRLKKWEIQSEELPKEDAIIPEGADSLEKAYAELASMDPRRAVEVVVGKDDTQGILNVETLEYLRQHETRKLVLKAIEAQINFMLPPKKDE